MDNKPFEPSSVTKPIQLLAAWLVGLITVNGSFLAAAAAIHEPPWAAGFLVICAAADVPIFLAALFLLQTRFRPEMQEDTFYARYLERKSADTQKSEIVRLDVKDSYQKRLGAGSDRARHSIQHSSKYGVQVNDLLDNIENIRQVFAENHIEITGYFGSSSDEPDIPTRKIVSFGKDADVGLLSKIVTLLVPLGFDELSVADEPYHGNRIYVGSYIYRKSPNKPKKITDGIMRLMSSKDLTMDEVIKVLKRRTPNYG